MPAPAVYYNEHDPFCCAWLRELITVRELPDGEIDDRDIWDVHPDDLRGFQQCHFFAGIGGWAYALRLAGWPADRAVWTGSCPCQPFSAAGKGAGFTDARHLWPAWEWLIRQCRPPVIFGEQVDAARAWLDLVCTDLEKSQYAVGAVDLPAGSVGAFHRRQRIYFVADAMSAGRPEGWAVTRNRSLTGCGDLGRLADAEHAERREVCRSDEDESDRDDGGRAKTHSQSGARRTLRDMADANGRESSDGNLQRSRRHDEQPKNQTAHFWSAVEWLLCTDGKARAVEPGTFPLAHGVPNRVGRLRGYGNAIVPQVAETVIRAYLDATPGA